MGGHAKIEYKNCAVAFIDLLGFKEQIFSMENDQEKLQNVYDVLLEMKRVKKIAAKSLIGGIEVSVFSDSIVISADRQNAFELIWRSGWLQSQLLYLGVLCRGGIALGKTVHKDDIIFGEGMIKAYNLESKVAVYPRIVIDHKIANGYPNEPLSICNSYDSDGCAYINPFDYPLSQDQRCRLSKTADTPPPYFEQIGKHLDDRLQYASKPEHLQKLFWLATLFNKSVEEKEPDQPQLSLRNYG